MSSHYQHTPGTLQYRKDIFKESMEYNVLTISEMSDKDRKFVLKQLVNLNSRSDVETFLLKDISKLEELKSHCTYWSFNTMDLHGRVTVLKYKGMEVAIFIIRQMTKRRIDPEHPVSEAKMKDPENAWMRFDLFGLSAKLSRKPTVEVIGKLERSLEKTEQKLAVQIAINERLESEVKRANRKNTSKKEKRREAKVSRKDHSSTRRKESSRHRKVVKRSGKRR